MNAGSEWTAVIIEDDPDVRELIDVVLTQSGFTTYVAENGPEGVEAVRANNPLITTLDVNMPGMDGFAVAKRLREFSNTYLIMITALAEEIDVVQGFEAGADDYLVKPFRPRELRARADSMLRRPRARQDKPGGWTDADPPPDSVPAPEKSVPAPEKSESWATVAARELTANVPPQPLSLVHDPVERPVQQPTVAAAPAPGRHLERDSALPSIEGSWVQFNGLSLSNETRVVTVGGAPVELTRTEFDLLASLLSTGRRVRSKADLVLTMRGQQYVTSYFVNEADKRSVEVHIANLRRKIGDNTATPRFVETVRGVGYRLALAD